MRRNSKLVKQMIAQTICVFAIYHFVPDYVMNFVPDYVMKRRGTISNKRKHVIIWTEARTGSTFLADILQRTKSTYYISEPINTLAGCCSSLSPSQLNELTEFLKRVLHCDFSKPKEYWEKYKGNRQFQNVALRDLYRDSLLYSFWNTSGVDEMICKASNVVLTKQIVLPVKQSLQIMEDTSINPYIIHLVRDPRSLMASRRKMSEKDLDLRNDLRNVTLMCKNLKENLYQAEIIKQKYPRRYLRVRYEDLTRDTEFTAREILKWVGIPYNAEVAATIAVNTLGFAYTDTEIPKATFSTIRNTAAHQDAWRKELDFDEVLHIQSACADVMADLGYRIYTTIDQYTDHAIPPVVTHNGSLGELHIEPFLHRHLL